MDFVAIDFETANAQLDSVCALGIAIVRDSKIVERKYSLVNPEKPFEKFCTYIHNITAARVEGMPTFNDLYPKLFEILDGQYVVAHNASFDYGVLKASCESRGLPLPDCRLFCTVAMSQKAWPELPKHKLSALCEAFSLDLNHHNAVDDATACAQILLRCAKEKKAGSIPELKMILDIK